MKLIFRTSGLSLLVVGLLLAFSTNAQADHRDGYYDYDKWKEYFCKKYPSSRKCKPKPACEYDLRDGAFFTNANNRPSDGKGKPTQNELIVFLRDPYTGLLSKPVDNDNYPGEFDTHRVKSGGFGNQEGIVTSGQNAVIHTGSGDDQWVFMINAGFDVTQRDYYYDEYRKKQPREIDRNGSVSVFKITKCEAKLTDVDSTYGQQPRAVDRDTREHADWKDWYRSQRDLVYVVNAGSGLVQFNGCPGLPATFLAPTGITCNAHLPVDEKDLDDTSVVGYKFDAKYGKLEKVDFARTADTDGDSAQISFVNDGKQVLVSQRNTFFALGDGKEDDIVEVFNLDKWGKITSGPFVSQTTGNDNFGFHVLEPGDVNYNAKGAPSCVFLTHGSFQQRNQGGASVFAVDEYSGSTIGYIPNKPDGGSDTCWTAISRTNHLYTSAFFDSEISIRRITVDDAGCCNLVDGGPPVIVAGGQPQFTGDVANTGQVWAFPENAGYQHRVTSSAFFKGGPFGGCPDIDNPLCRNGDQALVTDQTDFLFEAGGLDMSISKDKYNPEYLYVLWAPIPFSTGQDGEYAKGAPKGGNWLWPAGTSVVTIFKVVEDCGTYPTARESIYDDGCRVGDLEFVAYTTGIDAQSFGAAAN